MVCLCVLGVTNSWCISFFETDYLAPWFFSWMIVSQNVCFFFLNYWRLVLFFINKAQGKLLFHFELTGKMIDEYYAFITTYPHVWPLKICKEHVSKLRSCSVKEIILYIIVVRQRRQRVESTNELKQGDDHNQQGLLRSIIIFVCLHF